MSNHHEALRLADWLERGNYNHEDATKAAVELHRLHALNQELLESLELAQQCLGGSTDPTLLPRTYKVVNAAIAKAKS